MFGVQVVRRSESTFAARADSDPAIVIPPAPVGEVEERLRLGVQRHQEKVAREAPGRGGKPQAG